METLVASKKSEGPPMVYRERIRSGRKAFLRGDWSKAKRCFLEVLDGPATEEEKAVARRYLHEVYILEARETRAHRRPGGRKAPSRAGGAGRPASTHRGSRLKKTWFWNFMRFGKSR